MDVPCNICNAATIEHARELVRRRHAARYLRCSNCGFIFVEKPAWLAEAYAEPINRSDTGYVGRNLYTRDRVHYCIGAHLNPEGMFLDYAAGYGLFVRLMRDIGYDFRWSDLYCQNIFSKGFESPNPLTGPFEAVTAFEVFEHLVNPREEMEKLSLITPCLIFSTTLIPEPAPLPRDWWYYGLEHGQHIALYTQKSLSVLGDQFGYHYVTDGLNLHVFSKKQISSDFFSPPKIPRWRFWAKRNSIATRASLIMPDHDLIVRQLEEEQSKLGGALNRKI